MESRCCQCISSKSEIHASTDFQTKGDIILRANIILSEISTAASLLRLLVYLTTFKTGTSQLIQYHNQKHTPNMNTVVSEDLILFYLFYSSDDNCENDMKIYWDRIGGP